ncbi:hypothetical protein HDU76_013504, partial [Blyttiomyces sp. JEL0837]
MSSVRVIYEGTTYGPFRGQITLKDLSKCLNLPKRTYKSLIPVDVDLVNDHVADVVIPQSYENEPIEPGFYTLISRVEPPRHRDSHFRLTNLKEKESRGGKDQRKNKSRERDRGLSHRDPSVSGTDSRENNTSSHSRESSDYSRRKSCSDSASSNDSAKSGESAESQRPAHRDSSESLSTDNAHDSPPRHESIESLNSTEDKHDLPSRHESLETLESNESSPINEQQINDSTTSLNTIDKPVVERRESGTTEATDRSLETSKADHDDPLASNMSLEASLTNLATHLDSEKHKLHNKGRRGDKHGISKGNADRAGLRRGSLSIDSDSDDYAPDDKGFYNGRKKHESAKNGKESLSRDRHDVTKTKLMARNYSTRKGQAHGNDI